MSGIEVGSTDFGKGCEPSGVDNPFEMVTSLAWEVSPIRPPSTQGRQYPEYTINVIAKYDGVLHLRPPMINGTLAWPHAKQAIFGGGA